MECLYYIGIFNVFYWYLQDECCQLTYSPMTEIYQTVHVSDFYENLIILNDNIFII